MTHPDWCTKACDAGREGGKHRGAAIKVGEPGRILASVWLEQKSGGEIRVGFTAGFSAVAWMAEEAERVAAAVAEVAAMAGRVRV